MKTCPNCQKEIEDQFTHCPFCGYGNQDKSIRPNSEDQAPSIRYIVRRRKGLTGWEEKWELDRNTLIQWISEKKINAMDEIYDPETKIGEYAKNFDPNKMTRLSDDPIGVNSKTQGPPRPINSKSIISLVLGIVSFLYFGVLASVPAAFLGWRELRAIKAGHSLTSGRRMAKAGFILGIINIVICLLFFIVNGRELMTLFSPLGTVNDFSNPCYAQCDKMKTECYNTEKLKEDGISMDDCKAFTIPEIDFCKSTCDLEAEYNRQRQKNIDRW